jgi:hypothetical protein
VINGLHSKMPFLANVKNNDVRDVINSVAPHASYIDKVIERAPTSGGHAGTGSLFHDAVGYGVSMAPEILGTVGGFLGGPAGVGMGKSAGHMVQSFFRNLGF